MDIIPEETEYANTTRGEQPSNDQTKTDKEALFNREPGQQHQTDSVIGVVWCYALSRIVKSDDPMN